METLILVRDPTVSDGSNESPASTTKFTDTVIAENLEGAAFSAPLSDPGFDVLLNLFDMAGLGVHVDSVCAACRPKIVAIL